MRPLTLALSLSAAVAGAVPAVSLAQETNAQQAQATRSVNFNIASQPLSSALTAFARQAGLQIVMDPATVAGRTSASISGTMTAEQALQRLLAGTGIAYQFNSATTVSVGPGLAGSGALQLDPVQVQGVFPVPSQAMIDNLPPPYAGGQVATGGQLGLLGNRDVMDTPFNQTNYTAKKAQDQQAKTVRDVLIDDPSVRAADPDASQSSDGSRIRGFTIGIGGQTYGGLFGMLPTYSIMAEMAERVELLKGPSVMLNGMPPAGTIGGTINVVPKRAPDRDLSQFTANYVSAGQVGGHADVARRFGPDKEFGIRFNGVFRAGQTEVVNTSDRRGLAVLGLDFRGERVRLSADFGYQYQYIGGLVSYLGLANGVPLPWAPNARQNPGPSWNYQERKDLFGVVRGEVDLTERITAYAAFGAHDNRLEGLYVPNVVAANSAGSVLSATPYQGGQYGTYLTGEVGIRALVDTGPISHEFALTATAYTNDNGAGYNGGPSFATNIYNPTVVARPSIAMPAVNKVSTQGLSSLGFADTLSAAGKRVQLTAGARLQQVTAANFDESGAQTSSYSEGALSPAVALVVKPFWENVSLYANWIQGLQQGTIIGSTFANAGEVFPPFKSTQYEVGIKIDWGKFTTTASLFQISQPSILTNVATNTQFLGGEQRNQGLEFNFFGEPIEGVRLLGGFMLLNAVLTKTQGGLTDGWIAPVSPRFNLNLAGEWDMPYVPGLTLNGRMIYTGSQYIDTTWPRRSLPEWIRFDLGARYAFENPGAKGKLLIARFNVENILDANYWEGGGASSLFLGAPRTFRLSLTADF